MSIRNIKSRKMGIFLLAVLGMHFGDSYAAIVFTLETFGFGEDEGKVYRKLEGDRVLLMYCHMVQGRRFLSCFQQATPCFFISYMLNIPCPHHPANPHPLPLSLRDIGKLSSQVQHFLEIKSKGER